VQCVYLILSAITVGLRQVASNGPSTEAPGTNLHMAIVNYTNFSNFPYANAS
jgi:hypothetical protein